jgi:hypothetical protein
MKRPQKCSTVRRYAYRPLLIAALAVGGFLQFVTPLLADGTTAGTQISNTATATYEDPNQPGTPINATSNAVVVTVAEVAGITVTPLATTDINGGTVLPNDIVNYDYRITNVGNDPTQFVIPGLATVTGPGQAGTLRISTNGGTSFTDIPAGGLTTASIPSGGSVIVRVPVTVNGLAPSGAPITVVLGNTGANDNSAGTQNQTYPTAPAGNDVYTADNPNGTAGESTGAPANGEREASASQQVLVGAQPQAFASVFKTRSNYTDSGTAALNDDILTYGLSVQVNSTAPAGSTGLTPANLIATPINLNGNAASTQILISDAIPAGTVLTGTPTAPTGWTVVYTNSPTSTTANTAAWQSNPANIGGIANATRIGFVNVGPIAAGTTITGFNFQVVTTNITTTTTVANMAQLFGQTQGGGTTLVYDESGDQFPSNFNDNGTPGSNTPTTGVANPTTDGVDSGNNNTGTGPGGEDNVFTLASPGTILNGPNSQPAAVGPTNNNDDFTNQSWAIAANTTPTSLIDPGNVNFTNTLSNPSTTTALAGILLVPDDGGATGTVPTNTTVVLTYGAQTATYTYNGTDFIFTSGSTILIPSLAAGQSVNYTVTVNLPANTPLSTDTGFGFPVTVYAFVDSAPGTPGSVSGRPDATDLTQNATIDRVYTGFLRMVKEARILNASGTPLEGFSQAPSATNIRPGNFIEYRITYTNISTAPAGAGNRLLSATNVVITEDGTVLPNNWATDQDSNGAIDTSNVVGTAGASNGTITFFPSGDQTGTTAATDVTRYVNTLGVIVEPQASGTFTFRRRIN